MAGQPVLLKDLQLPDAELERLRAAFDFLDKDGDGFIEHAELMAALGELGFHDEHDAPDPTVLGGAGRKKTPKPPRRSSTIFRRHFQKRRSQNLLKRGACGQSSRSSSSSCAHSE